ncbi:uncharacterized protein [Arachis hypogaea]|uniref:uncharacterized protein n=1 Tax=Arachis hypogaea TaxID=3818 RepID=UPI003B21A44D
MAFLAAVFILPTGTLFILSGLIVNAMQIQEFDEARKKFSNAKSLSSSQFFYQNKAADVAAQATLSKFSGSSAISSAVHTLVCVFLLLVIILYKLFALHSYIYIYIYI